MVIGAGQAGLSSGYFLARRGLDPETGFVVLDAGAGAGGAWRHRWPALRLDTTHAVHDLPGLPFRPDSADVPAAVAVPAYFAEYEQAFSLPLRRPVSVRAVRPGEDGRLLVDSFDDVWRARALINATGTWSRPFWPAYPGRELFAGRQLHTADYTGAEQFAGQHVVVVGGGASAVQLLGEISRVARTTWVTRRPPVWQDGPFTPERGRAAVALVQDAVREGRPPGSVVGLTGLLMTPWVREAYERGVLQRLPMFDRLTPEGVAWSDGRRLRADVVLWATGFRAELAHLTPLRLREPGGGIRLIGTRAAREPRVHLLGYGPSASTLGASRAARAASLEVRRLLDAPPQVTQVA